MGDREDYEEAQRQYWRQVAKKEQEDADRRREAEKQFEDRRRADEKEQNAKRQYWRREEEDAKRRQGEDANRRQQENAYYANYRPADEKPKAAIVRQPFGGTVVSVFFYLWGLFWSSIGLVALSTGLSGGSVADALWFFPSCLVGLVILVLLQLFRKRPDRGAWTRLWLEIGLLFIGFLFAAFGAGQTIATVQNIAVGSTLVIYGLIAAFVAYW